MTKPGWIVVLVTVAVGVWIVLKSVSSPLKLFAQAIASAEGFGTPGAIPTVRNNPGDLRWTGSDITTFETVDQGWQALYQQLTIIVNGSSSFYTLDMSILDMAQLYANPDPPANWAANVVAYLNAHGRPDVTVNTPLGSVLV